MCVLELCKCNICPQENATCIVESMCFVQYTYLAANVASLSFLLLASFVVNAHGFSVLVLVCRPPPPPTHTHAHTHSHTHTYTHTHTAEEEEKRMCEALQPEGYYTAVGYEYTESKEGGSVFVY